LVDAVADDPVAEALRQLAATSSQSLP
jgi:hypothetical protein